MVVKNNVMTPKNIGIVNPILVIGKTKIANKIISFFTSKIARTADVYL